MTTGLANDILLNHGGKVWGVLDQEIQPETMGKTVRHRMQLLGKLIIQKVSTDGQVFLTHRGHKMYDQSSFIYEYTWEGRRVLTSGSGADPI